LDPVRQEVVRPESINWKVVDTKRVENFARRGRNLSKEDNNPRERKER